jgi:hypothetical protein
MSARTNNIEVGIQWRLARVALLSLLVMLASSTVASSGDESKMDAFAKCLTANKATMYGSFWCSHCDDQKKLFGKSFRHVNYVECSVPGSRQMSLVCQFAQIRLTPTWIFADGERREGMQTLQQLSTKTGCPLP